ncbi:hypothetical protein GOP47_0021327 [Adiantum capillus-veneris]|uniref:Protein kinase domain-containing protein n=1 Tax=Adiantum capillus-veneris TaxID=13818 RepID=A0A9D4Z8J5_ADICA|nr:hypothetical protein GOP47_0021327 [Adiantum capillus-veneris]
MALSSCTSSSASRPPVHLYLFPLAHLLILIFSSFPASFFPVAHSLQLSFLTFHPNYDQSLQFSTNSNVDNQALQITRNSGSSDVSNSSGQITYSQPMQLRHKSYNYLASFNTSFLINMGPIMGGGTPNSGGGMTFMLSSKPAILNLPNSFGQWLGLFDSQATLQEQQAQVVAIELDTFKDSFDPDANHVGIDVNGSVRSIFTMSLSPEVMLTNTSALLGINTSVWIDYDGHLRTLDVFLANQGSYLSKLKPTKPVISGYSIDLSDYLPDTVYVGFSASMGTILEAHCVIQWNFNSNEFPKTIPLSTILGSTVGALAALVLLVVGLVAVLRWRRRRAEGTLDMNDLTNLQYGPQKFPYKELKKATRGFSEDCKLGQGGFGEVYKGVIRSKDGTQKEVAVKCLSHRSKQGEKEFKAEVMSMGRMRHKNLVQLLGWSYGRRQLMLVYEYMPNRSLDQWIGEVAEVLGWERRYHVIKGVAAGLLYLHEEWEKVVVHRDLKPSNVMLDAEFNASIGDFGLAKLFDFEEDILQTATVAGTPGYIAPECIDQGIISKEVDIYSLGVLAIELATGRRISTAFLQSLSLLFKNSTLEEAADPRLDDRFNRIQLELLLKVGLACCQLDPSARPTIRDIVHTLSTSGTSPILLATPSISSFSSGHPSLSHAHILNSTSFIREMQFTGR